MGNIWHIVNSYDYRVHESHHMLSWRMRDAEHMTRKCAKCRLHEVFSISDEHWLGGAGDLVKACRVARKHDR